MKIFDLYDIESFPYSSRDKNVFYYTDEFKTRIIELAKGDKIPECEMDSYVVFYVIKGEAVITVNTSTSTIDAGKCVITSPAIISLKSDSGARLLGIQIKKQND
ncbi:MAG: hypothetical protein H8E13_06275 [Actinobacteria bacterium]|nr:hypothetical protein [Actinomycetota bacterium]